MYEYTSPSSIHPKTTSKYPATHIYTRRGAGDYWKEVLIEADGVPLQLAVSKVPIEDWIALLETSGWGVIEDTQFSYVEVSTSYKYPIGS